MCESSCRVRQGASLATRAFCVRMHPFTPLVPGRLWPRRRDDAKLSFGANQGIPSPCGRCWTVLEQCTHRARLVRRLAASYLLCCFFQTISAPSWWLPVGTAASRSSVHRNSREGIRRRREGRVLEETRDERFHSIPTSRTRHNTARP